MTQAGSAGTRGQTTTPAPHLYVPAPRDPGERARCQRCGQSRHDGPK